MLSATLKEHCFFSELPPPPKKKKSGLDEDKVDFSHNVVTMETSAIGWPPWLITFWYLLISVNNCTCSCMKHWHDSFRSRGIKMESIKVAIQLHWFLWPPRYVKLVYKESFLKICGKSKEKSIFFNQTKFVKRKVECTLLLVLIYSYRMVPMTMSRKPPLQVGREEAVGRQSSFRFDKLANTSTPLLG